MTFNEKLSALRKQAGMSQEDLAEKLGVSRQAVSRWEAGSTLPDAVNLLGLSDLFHVTVDSLLRDDALLKENIERDPEPFAAEPQTEPAAQPPAFDRRKRDVCIAAAIFCFVSGMVTVGLGFGLRWLTGIGNLSIVILLPVFAACMFGTGFFAVKAAKQNTGRGLEPAAPTAQTDRRKRDKLILACAAFFLAGVVFLATAWIYWNYIVGALWLHLGAGAACLFVAGFCGFRLYVVTHSNTEREKKDAQANLALVTAVLNMISGICFAFSAGLSGMWLYWLAAALLIASAIGEYVRWQKLKYGE